MKENGGRGKGAGQGRSLTVEMVIRCYLKFIKCHFFLLKILLMSESSQHFEVIFFMCVCGNVDLPISLFVVFFLAKPLPPLAKSFGKLSKSVCLLSLLQVRLLSDI